MTIDVLALSEIDLSMLPAVVRVLVGIAPRGAHLHKRVGDGAHCLTAFLADVPVQERIPRVGSCPRTMLLHPVEHPTCVVSGTEREVQLDECRVEMTD